MVSASGARAAVAAQTRWTTLARIGFRIAFVYFLLDTAPRVIYYLPGGASVPPIGWVLWRPVVPWVGKHILHLSKDITVLAGYDTAFGYVLAFCRLITAIAAGAIWTLADRKPRDYRGLNYWLRVLLRYEVAASVLEYGTAKVFQQQFPTPDLTTLIQPFGALSPHSLLWSFMGFSRTYQVFTGSVECLGAVLLFFRRTTTLGAFLLVAAMTNVAVMDLCYGTFVKMIAVHLLLASAFLTFPDLGRLANVLFLRRPVSDATDDGPVWSGLWRRRVIAAGKAAVVIYFIAAPSLHAYRTSKTLTRDQSRPPLYGVYAIERFTRDGQEVAFTDPRRWTMAAFDGLAKGYSLIAVRLADETWRWDRTYYDETKQNLTIDALRPAPQLHLAYSATSDGYLLRGVLDGAQVEIALHRIPEPKFQLNDPDGVRWVARW